MEKLLFELLILIFVNEKGLFSCNLFAKIFPSWLKGLQRCSNGLVVAKTSDIGDVRVIIFFFQNNHHKPALINKTSYSPNCGFCGSIYLLSSNFWVKMKMCHLCLWIVQIFAKRWQTRRVFEKGQGSIFRR